jgi:hypothetical protein
MAINGSGIRDTVRVLGIGINTVIKQIKKISKNLNDINLKYLYEKKQRRGHIIVDLIKVECDEMWSFIEKKVINDGYDMQ